MTDSSIFRFHVRVEGKRTSISLDPDLFRALTFKLGSSTAAKDWIQQQASSIPPSTKSLSRKIQGNISLLLAGLEETAMPALSTTAGRFSGAVEEAQPKVNSANFKSDDLPL